MKEIVNFKNHELEIVKHFVLHIKINDGSVINANTKLNQTGIYFGKEEAWRANKKIKYSMIDGVPYSYIIKKASTDLEVGPYDTPLEVLYKKANEELCQPILNLDFISLNDASLYRYPNLTLPRTQVDLLKDKFDLNVTRKKESSDFRVINKDQAKSNLARSSYELVTMDNLMKFIDNIAGRLQTHVYNDIREQAFAIGTAEPDALVEIDMVSSWKNEHADIKKSIQAHMPDKQDGNYREVINIHDLDLFKDLLECETLILDSDLSQLCMEDSVAIDEQQFLTLSKMLGSDDLDNRKLALEMMANSNVAASYDKIAILFFRHLDAMKNTKHWNHINVKTMRSRMKHVPQMQEYNAHIWPFESLLSCLSKNNAVSEFAVKYILKDMSDTIFKQIGLNESKFWTFDINDLKLKQEEKKVEEVDLMF